MIKKIQIGFSQIEEYIASTTLGKNVVIVTIRECSPGFVYLFRSK